MNFSNIALGKEQEIVALFKHAFTTSEGPEEGRIIGNLTADLLALEQKDDVHIFTAYKEADLVGTVIFSRLRYSDDQHSVFLLSPMAVASNLQKQGIGQKLINHALEKLRIEGVDSVVTYGDPAFYSKTGFKPLDKNNTEPPHKLSMPQGWIGQSLTDKPLPLLHGKPQCVPPLNKPELW